MSWPIFKKSCKPLWTSLISCLFCKNIISDTTCVPAVPLKVSSGSRIAPKKLHLSPIYFLTLSSFLSNVPEDVIKEIIPPGRTLSMLLAKKKSWIRKLFLL